MDRPGPLLEVVRQFKLLHCRFVNADHDNIGRRHTGPPDAVQKVQPYIFLPAHHGREKTGDQTNQRDRKADYDALLVFRHGQDQGKTSNLILQTHNARSYAEIYADLIQLCSVNLLKVMKMFFRVT
jgi:hypothetical protein